SDVCARDLEGKGARASRGDRGKEAAGIAVGERAGSAVDGGQAGQIAAGVREADRLLAVRRNAAGLFAARVEVDFHLLGRGVGESVVAVLDERAIVLGGTRERARRPLEE